MNLFKAFIIIPIFFLISCSAAYKELKEINVGNAETSRTARMKTGVVQSDHTIKKEPTMSVDNVAKAVIQMANLPLDTNILFMTIMATNMPLVGRG